MSWTGDLRYRVAKAKEAIDEERSYQQLRARLGLKAEVNEEINLYFRLATGSSATSTNQTLGDSKDPGMPRRSFGLDLSYLEWKVSVPSLLWAGRTPNPFWSPGKNQMVFDSDLAFEGIAIKWDQKWSTSRAFLNLGSSMISENYDTSARQDIVDTGIVGAQVGYSIKSEWGVGTLHYSHYEYVNIQDKNITNIDAGAKVDVYSTPHDRFKGNAVNRPDPLVQAYFFKNKYVLESSGIEWKWSVQAYEISAFYDKVENTQVARVSEATEKGVGFRWGRSQIQYAEVQKEAESVLGAFTDSDSNGGGTDNKGQRISYSYQFSNSSQVVYTQYEAQRGSDTVRRDFSSSSLDFVVWF